MIQEQFERVLGSYISERKNDLKSNQLADLVRNGLPETIRKSASIGRTYKVEGSPGQGNWAEVPWISIFDRGITESAQHGYYIVYLFNASMRGVYLSLNQGWTQYQETYKPLDAARDRIKANAEKCQILLKSTLTDFTFTPILLDAHNVLGHGYELGHICGKYYEATAIPGDEVLVNDLRNLIGVYRELKGLVGKDILSPGQMALPAASVAEEEEDQLENNEAPPTTPPPGPQAKPKKRRVRGREYYPRNPGFARTALINAGYRCEIDPKHETFKLKTTGNPYMETHHIVPMRFQDGIDVNIDLPENIVSLCPTCHQLLHRAVDAERKEHIESIFHSRTPVLRSRGINVSLETVLKYYSIATGARQRLRAERGA